ncbi:MAG: bifunctional DNA-formamidopyrimidine glycosylase/DNA-(apurinic or apyrimidinic site) lyase [Candidatus Gottesmanbacteria bacterium]
MPELPEVETIRRGLVSKIKGLTIKKIEVLLSKQFKGNPQDVEGAEILDVKRKGKVTIIELDNRENILIHLKMTGQLIFVENQHNTGHVTLNTPIPFGGGNILPAKSTHIIFYFDNGSRLFFNDSRQFGWIKIIKNSELRTAKELQNLGPEPFDKEFTVEYLQKIFSKTSKSIKLVLMDQEKIAGVGNIYANDALWEAKIRPDKPAKELGNLEIKKLREGIIKVLNEGLRYGGSTGGDEAFINVEAEPGKYQNHFKVYQREREKCLRNDGGIIRRITIGGRGTFYCPACQR